MAPYRDNDYKEPIRPINAWPYFFGMFGAGSGLAVVLWIALAIHSCPGDGERRRNAEVAAMDYARHVNEPGVRIRVQCMMDQSMVHAECVVVVNGRAAHLLCDTEPASDNAGCHQELPR